MLSQHGLIEKAKVAYINLLFSSKEASVKAKCLYELGLIALEEKEIGRAIKYTTVKWVDIVGHV